MKLVLAEKPSVAQSIAKVLGAAKREDGYLEGNGYVVSWCVGHLVELAQPEVYDAKYSKWAYADLPIFPMDWQYEVSAGTKKQFGILKKLMAREDVASLVCATDAGREGELIFRLVYHKAGCRKPFERLWISSMEDVAIKEGFENLRSGTEYDALYEAALCRERADWIVGINATRLFSTLYGQTLNVGRVMTPTLAMAVMRESAISAFKPEPFYTVQIGLDGFTVASERFKTKAAAEAVRQGCSVDTVLKQKPKSFDGFVQALADMGFEFKDGKQPAFKGENQKRFIRLRSLGEGYNKEEIQAVISGKNLHKSKGSSAKAPAPKQFQMLIDIQAKMAEGKTVGYEKWAKKFNRKEAARTVILLKEKGLGNYDDLTAHIENLSARFDALSDSIKAAEKQMVEVQALQQHIKNYRNTRQIYIEYRKSGYSKKFFEEHRQEITIHKAAKQAFDELQITKLPSTQSLYEEFHLEQLLQTVGKVKRQINPKLQIDGILLTMVDNRTNFAKEIAALLRDTYGSKIKVFSTEIPHSVRAKETSAEGKSIFAHDPNGKVAEAYQNLTREVIKLEKQREKSRAGIGR